MLYLLGGAARAGKSTIAKQFLKERGVPFFCLDWLMMGFARGLPAFGVDPEDDELHVGHLLWPVVHPMALTLLEDEEDYLIEGVQLHPQQVDALRQEWGDQVRACFVGYADMDSRAKLSHIRAYGGGPDDWLRDYDDQQLLATIERLKALSRTLRDECARWGMPYVETGIDLQPAIDSVVHLFRTGSMPTGSPTDDSL